MKKNFRAIKASIVMGIMLVSISAALLPTSSAAGFGITQMEPQIQVDYDTSNTDNIIPDNPVGKYIDINISYQISGLFAKFAVNRYNYASTQVQINLAIGTHPSYLNAALTQQTLYAPVALNFADGKATPTASLHVTFTKDAPYLAQEQIPIIITATLPAAFPWSVRTLEVTKNIPVSAAYLPVIDVTPSQRYIETTPGGIISIPISCNNIGNGETLFRFQIVNLPEGWTATMLDSKIIPANSNEIIPLQVRGPIGFGYHDETRKITVNVKGIFYSESGFTTEVDRDFTVDVRSVGFYLSGFDAMILVIILIALIVVVYLFLRWKKSK